MQDILISVLVISYNSEKYILETLKSIKHQTYKNIELVISDDNSSDHTTELAANWLQKNRAFFKNTKIITSTINTGIAPNLNRGIKECMGQFIKPIAADDILMEDCLERNLEYCLRNNVKVLFSRWREFIEINGTKEFKDVPVDWEFFKLSSKAQLKKLMINNCVAAPTGFFAAGLFEQIGLFNEDYPFHEDLPYWVELTIHGYKLNFMDYVTVLYRKHEKSISSKQISSNISTNYLTDVYKFYKNVKKPYYIKHLMFLTLIDNETKFKQISYRIKNNGRDTFRARAILLLSPIQVGSKLADGMHKLTSRFTL